MEGNAAQSAARDINVLGGYLAKRDIGSLTPGALRGAIGTQKVDLLILFGGSIPFGIDAAAVAYQGGIARRMMVVGGIGHTTGALQEAIAVRCPKIETRGRPEADIIADYLAARYGIASGELLIENRSANCGENAEFALAAVRQSGFAPDTVLLMQDSTMQRRMEATMLRAWKGHPARFLSFAAYRANVAARDGRLTYTGDPIDGMWDIERYVTMLMGEIPRLRDNAEGYGPSGRGYIEHVDIPDEAEAAFVRLNRSYESRAPRRG